MAQKLQHSGFVRIDSNGLFEADRYVMPDQIGRVDQDGIQMSKFLTD